MKRVVKDIKERWPLVVLALLWFAWFVLINW